MRHEKLTRLIAVPNRQKTFAKKANGPRCQQTQQKRLHRHLKSPRRNHEYFKWIWRRQKRSHQNAEEAVSLDPSTNGLRARPGVFVKHRFPALARDVIKKQAPRDRA